MNDLKFRINDKELNIDEAYKLYKELEKVFGHKTMFTYSPPVHGLYETDWKQPYEVTCSGSWV